MDLWELNFRPLNQPSHGHKQILFIKDHTLHCLQWGWFHPSGKAGQYWKVVLVAITEKETWLLVLKGKDQKLKNIYEYTEQNSSRHTINHLAQNIKMDKAQKFYNLTTCVWLQQCLLNFYILSILCGCVCECMCVHACGGQRITFRLVLCLHHGFWELNSGGQVCSNNHFTLWTISLIHQSLCKENFKNIITL